MRILNFKRWLANWKTGAIALAFGMAAAIVPPAIAFAEILASSPLKLSLRWPAASEDVGAPERTISSSSRHSEDEIFDTEDFFFPGDGMGICTAIAPDERATKTARARPTLFAYISHADESIIGAELALFHAKASDLAGKPIAIGAPVPFSLPDGANILAISLPPSLALAAGREYYWSIALLRDDGSHSGLVGRIERTHLTETPPDGEDPIELAQWYAERHLWHETMAALVRSRRQHPEEWQEFLASVGLERASDKNIVFVEPEAVESKSDLPAGKLR